MPSCESGSLGIEDPSLRPLSVKLAHVDARFRSRRIEKETAAAGQELRRTVHIGPQGRFDDWSRGSSICRNGGKIAARSLAEKDSGAFTPRATRRCGWRQRTDRTTGDVQRFQLAVCKKSD